MAEQADAAEVSEEFGEGRFSSMAKGFSETLNSRATPLAFEPTVPLPILHSETRSWRLVGRLRLLLEWKF